MTRTKSSIPGGLYAGRAGKEDDVMRRRVVSGVLAVMGILALSAGAAQAGSGGKPFPLTSFFVCNGINGDAPNQVVGSLNNGTPNPTPIPGSSVDVVIPGIGPFRNNVRIGNGSIACAVAQLFVSGFVAPDGSKAEILPNNSAGTNNKQLVCYNVTVSTRNSAQSSGSPHPSYSIINQFFPATDTSPPAATETGVQDNGIQFICAPSGMTSP